MLKKLTTKGVNKQINEFEERTANLACSGECLRICLEVGGDRFNVYNSGLEHMSLPHVLDFPKI